MQPAFLLTTTNYLLAFDGDDQFFQVHTGKGLYYGLAQDDQRIYVSCRNQTIGPHDATARANETGSILVFDAASLTFLAEFRPEDFPLRDVHGIACFDGKLWVTSSFDNLIAVLDTATHGWTKWYPAVDLAARERDVNHFNTIVPHGERIYVLAHNHGPSHLLSYDRATLELCSAVELGRQAHDIFPTGGGFGTCSSADGELVASSGWTIRTGAFPRGIAYGGDQILVGLSQVGHRSVRHQLTPIVRCFTTRWEHRVDYLLPEAGMLLAILPIALDSSVLSSLRGFDSQRFHHDYNPLEPGNVYDLRRDGNALFAAEWHCAEQTHRWTAARESRMTIVVNPGETMLATAAFSSCPGSYRTEVLLDGHCLGVLEWSQPGSLTRSFPLPPSLQGRRCELCFRVPHLWRPSAALATDDHRSLGVAIQTVTLLLQREASRHLQATAQFEAGIPLANLSAQPSAKL